MVLYLNITFRLALSWLYNNNYFFIRQHHDHNIFLWEELDKRRDDVVWMLLSPVTILMQEEEEEGRKGVSSFSSSWSSIWNIVAIQEKNVRRKNQKTIQERELYYQIVRYVVTYTIRICQCKTRNLKIISFSFLNCLLAKIDHSNQIFKRQRTQHCGCATLLLPLLLLIFTITTSTTSFFRCKWTLTLNESMNVGNW